MTAPAPEAPPWAVKSVGDWWRVVWVGPMNRRPLICMNPYNIHAGTGGGQTKAPMDLACKELNEMYGFRGEV